MYTWQMNILKQFEGFKPGEMIIYTAGRRVGKSVFSAQALKRMMDDINNRPVEKLVLGESRFHGARYYTVEPVGGNWLEMETWCTRQFGEAAEVWDLKSSNDQFVWPECGRWYKNARKFWFRNEADRTMFVLKWR